MRAVLGIALLCTLSSVPVLAVSAVSSGRGTAQRSRQSSGKASRWDRTFAYLTNAGVLGKSCFTQLGCPPSDCCLRKVLTNIKDQVYFDKAGHCGPFIALQDKDRFQVNYITGALGTVEERLRFFSAEAIDQDILIMCRSHVDVSTDPNREGPYTGKKDLIQPGKILDAVLAPQIAFARVVLPGDPSMPASTEHHSLETVHQEQHKPPTQTTLKRREPSLGHLRHQAIAAEHKLQSILSQLKSDDH